MSLLLHCLLQRSPDRKLAQADHQLQQLQARMKQAMQQRLGSAKNNLAMQAGRLDSVSPLNVLARGYSITKSKQGKVVKSASSVKSGDVLITELVDGTIESKVS